MGTVKSKETIILDETIILKNWAWGYETPIKKTSEHFEVSTSNDFGNSKHCENFKSIDEAVDMYGKKRNKGDRYDDYWNGEDEIVTKVTIITEIVKIIHSKDKV